MMTLFVLESLKFRLKAWNHKTLAALSLEQAQTLLNENDDHMGFIISDLRLGAHMDGVQAIANLRADLKAEVPGAILTGDTTPDRLKYIDNSGLFVLHKPVKADSLATVLNNTFKKIINLDDAVQPKRGNLIFV